MCKTAIHFFPHRFRLIEKHNNTFSFCFLNAPHNGILQIYSIVTDLATALYVATAYNQSFCYIDLICIQIPLQAETCLEGESKFISNSHSAIP